MSIYLEMRKKTNTIYKNFNFRYPFYYHLMMNYLLQFIIFICKLYVSFKHKHTHIYKLKKENAFLIDDSNIFHIQTLNLRISFFALSEFSSLFFKQIKKEFNFCPSFTDCDVLLWDVLESHY